MFAGRSALSCPPPALYRLGLDPGLHRLGNVERGDADPVSGDAAVGGTKAYITSEFAVAMQLAVVTTLFYGFFVSVAAGMTIIQDEQWRLGELIHATPLRPGEYIWAKFAAVLAGCLIILVLHLAAMLFFNHVLPNAEAQEIPRAASTF